MNEQTLPGITRRDTSGHTATYSIEPLAPGYGDTIGSTLQRTLPSSLPGHGITAMRLDGWVPGDQRLPGIKETVDELALNCKQVRVRWRDGGHRPCMLYVEAEGMRQVIAGDIVPPPGLEMVTPRGHLATLLHEKASLSLELLVEAGRGYVPADARKQPPPGMVPVDAIYTPVRRVSYIVEKTRVGPLVNFEKVLLTITTDGTLSPDDALLQGANVLLRHYVLLSTFAPHAPMTMPEPQSSVPIPPQISQMPIEQLGLPLRAVNSLRRSSITRVGQVLSMTEQDLHAIRNFGEQAFRHLQERIIALDLLPAASEPSDETASRADQKPLYESVP